MKLNLIFKSILVNCIITICIILTTIFVENNKQMSPVFTVPFFSGAANFKLFNKWKFGPEEVEIYKAKSLTEKEAYKFRKLPNLHLIDYHHNPIGYLYSIIIAKNLFFWVGDIRAAKYFQILIHLLTSLIIFNCLENYFAKFIFILFYSLNPLVIYFVTFPFLYFWQFIPSAIFFYLMIHKFEIRMYHYIIIGILLGFSYITRPTVLLILLLVLTLLFLNSSKKMALLTCIILISFVFIFNKKTENKSPWHTVYIGIGAYPNPYVAELSDNKGFDIYKKHTGEELNISIGGNFYDLRVFKQYDEFLQKEYSQIVRHAPLMLLKNAILNFFQSFSLGYFVDYPLWVSYLSSLFGFIFFMLLLIKRHFLWIIAIALSSLSFTPYYPPIQAYMFGSYILLVGALIPLLNDFGFESWLNSKVKKLNSSLNSNQSN